MANVHILSSLQMLSQGTRVTSKQGAATVDIRVPLAISVTGTLHERIGVLTGASVATVYDAANDLPATWDFLIVWTDAAVQLQLIDVAGTTNVTLGLIAFCPQIFAHGSLLGAANATVITDGNTTLGTIEKVVIATATGITANYRLILID